MRLQGDEVRGVSWLRDGSPTSIPRLMCAVQPSPATEKPLTSAKRYVAWCERDTPSFASCDDGGSRAPQRWTWKEGVCHPRRSVLGRSQVRHVRVEVALALSAPRCASARRCLEGQSMSSGRSRPIDIDRTSTKESPDEYSGLFLRRYVHFLSTGSYSPPLVFWKGHAFRLLWCRHIRSYHTRLQVSHRSILGRVVGGEIPACKDRVADNGGIWQGRHTIGSARRLPYTVSPNVALSSIANSSRKTSQL